MLQELHISNLAIIEDVAVTFGPGLNVFTGETGAGKSLVLGAFEVLLGLRPATASELVRPGADEGRVTGVFDIHDPHTAAAISALADQTVVAGDQLLVTRKLFASGRSSVSINGQPATATMLKQIGEQLVDIHGQHDHQYLLRPSNQLLILDAFGKCADLRDRYAKAYEQLRELDTQREALTASRTLRKQQLELYEFQTDEIDGVAPQPGEFPELDARHTLLKNLTKIEADAGRVHAALHDNDDAMVGRLELIAAVLGDLVELDEAVTPIAEQVRDATMGLQDAAFELSRYIDRLEANPAEAAEVEQRLNTLNRLIQKYGESLPDDDPLDAVIAYREQITEQIESLRGQDEDLASIDRRADALQKTLDEIGDALRAARIKAGEKLNPLVEAQLKDLGMAEARLEARIEPAEPGPNGGDTVELLIRTNPGQPFQPLRKIASGGELSRIMLALKSILAGSDRVSVLVFDEIDANIGGRLGSVIGEKLRALANPKPAKKNSKARAAQHQVLCITHLPQIAGYADRHFRIVKRVTGSGKNKTTRTTVTCLEGDDRVEELAEMMAGKKVTPTARQQAKELLAVS